MLNGFKNKSKVVQDVENASAWGSEVSVVVKNNGVVLASRHVIESCVW